MSLASLIAWFLAAALAVAPAPSHVSATHFPATAGAAVQVSPKPDIGGGGPVHKK